MNWKRWTPSDEQPWNLRRVAHLHRRAGFGASWEDLQRDVDSGHESVLARVLEGVHADGAGQFDALIEHVGQAAVGSNRPDQLKAWWLLRMLTSRYPLREKLTLMWHGHFATSNAKVRSLAAMKAQNEVFHWLAAGEFGDLLRAVAMDPAMLIWLDAPSNRKGRPNENLAREIMELFTLGIGNYAESDVRESARALTGWSLSEDRQFVVRDQYHDRGDKVILGQRGNWNGDDLIRILLDHEATSHRIAWRLCDTFMGEGVVSETRVASLAKILREQNLHIGKTVETIIRSEEFFHDQNIGSRITSPVEFAVSTMRALGLDEPPASTMKLASWTKDMGQDLFYPPNVGGWKGGRSWLSTRNIVMRANFAAQLAEGRLHSKRAIDGGKTRSSWLELPKDRDPVGFLGEVLMGRPITKTTRQRIQEMIKQTESDVPADQKTPGRSSVLRTLAFMLAMPEAQQG